MTGNPCASRMIPLESPVPEIGPPGSESGGRKRTHGSRPAARGESGRKSHRPPTGHAPPLDSTRIGSVPFYEGPFAHVAEHVRPMRRNNPVRKLRDVWWRHEHRAPSMWRVVRFSRVGMEASAWGFSSNSMSSGNSRPLEGLRDLIPESWICPRKRRRRLYRPPTRHYGTVSLSICSSRFRRSSPAFFERLVVDVLVAMGYGGSRREAGEAIGHAGDEGIDGIIKEDRLGLDIIYIQAKRWENKVGRPEVQRFAGALQGKRARKGVFITTSSFSREARDYADNIDTKVILIAGTQLAELMIDYGVAVTTDATYEVKRIDADYFGDE